MLYAVVYEARLYGALGAFHHVTLVVNAVNKDDASSQAMDALHRQNFETRLPVTVEPVVAT